MTDVATLVLAVDSRQVKSGEQSLDRLASTGAKAEGSAKRLTDATNNLGGAHSRLTNSIVSARSAMVAFVGTLALREIGQFAGKLYEAAAAAERLRLSFGFSFQATAGRELQYVKDLSQQLGLELQSTAAAYGKLSAAARGTAIAGEGARSIFEAVSKASVTMGLSAEQASGALTAIEQMISKGTVSAEELRGQLGERLPGAFQIAARAMGVTTQELGKMLEQGEVLSEDFLPKFARQLQTEIGDSAEKAADRLDAATNRMGNAFQRLMTAAAESGISQFLKSLAQGATNDLNAISDVMERRRAAGGGTLSQLNAAAGMAIGRTFGLQNFSDEFTTLDRQLTLTVAKVNELNAKPKLSLWERSDLATAQKRLAALTAEVQARSGAASDANALDARLIASGKVVQAQAAATARSESELADVRRKLYGVDKDYLPTLNKLQQQRDAGIISERAYIELVSDLAAKNYKKSDSDKSAAKAVKDHSDEQRKMSDLIAKLSGVNANYIEQLELLQTARKRLNLTDERYIELVTELISEQPAAKKQMQDMAKSEEDAANATARMTQERERSVSVLQEQVRALEKQVDTYSMTESQVYALAVAEKEREIASATWSDAKLTALNDELEALKRLTELHQRKEGLESTKRMTEELERDAKAAYERMGQSLTDNIMRGGKSAGEFLKDYFRTLVLRPIIQAAVNPIASAFTGVSQGGSLLNVLSGGGSGIVSTIGRGISTIGNFLGSAGIGSFGAGMQGASLAAGLAGPTTAGAGGLMGLGASFASALPYAALAGLAVTVAQKLFGAGKKEITAGGIQGSFTGTGFTGAGFEDWKRKGGLLKGGSSGTSWIDIDPVIEATLGAGFTAIKKSTKDFAKTLGIETGSLIDNFSESIRVEFNSNAEENKAMLGRVISDLGGHMAEALIPNLKALRLEGEESAATLQRLAGNYQALNEVMTSIGRTFGSVGVESLEARERLIALSGGLDALASGAALFAQEFLTESERLAITSKSVTDEMSRLGLANVKTRDQFKQTVQSLDLTTSTGAQTYVDLIKIAGAFDTVADAADAATQQVDTQAGSNIEDIRSKLSDAYERESSALRETIESFSDASRSGRDFLNSLFGGTSSPLSSRQIMARSLSQLEDTSALTKSADKAVALDAMNRLQGISQTFLETLKANSSTALDYARGFARVQGAIDGAADIADDQVSVAEQQLSHLDKAVSGILSVNESVLSVRELLAQYFNVGGTKTITEGPMAGQQSTYAVSDSLSAQINAYAAENGPTAYAVIPGVNDFAEKSKAANDLVQLGAFSDFDSAFTTAFGVTPDAWKTIEASAPKFASGGDHYGGGRWVGENGPEFEFTGPSTIVNSSNSRKMLQDGSDLVVAVKELIAVIREQDSNQEARDVALVKNTSAVVRIVDRWDGNGLPVRAHLNEPIPVDTTP